MSLRSALKDKAPELVHLLDTPPVILGAGQGGGPSPMPKMLAGMKAIYQHYGWEVPDIKNPVLMARDLESRINGR